MTPDEEVEADAWLRKMNDYSAARKVTAAETSSVSATYSASTKSGHPSLFPVDGYASVQAFNHRRINQIPMAGFLDIPIDRRLTEVHHFSDLVLRLTFHPQADDFAMRRSGQF
jgi:hypothetical protein